MGGMFHSDHFQLLKMKIIACLLCSNDLDKLQTIIEGELKVRFQSKTNGNFSSTYAYPIIQLTRDAIQKNPKSYSAWHHRQWVVDRWIDHEPCKNEGTKLIDADIEITLCDLMLNKDERNFHCWNYRYVFHLVLQAVVYVVHINFLHSLF